MSPPKSSKWKEEEYLHPFLCGGHSGFLLSAVLSYPADMVGTASNFCNWTLPSLLCVLLITGNHSCLEWNNIKISLKPITLSINCCYNLRVYVSTVMVISHKFWFARGVNPEISEQSLQDRWMYASLSYPLCPYALPFSRITDLYCLEAFEGFMTKSISILLSRKYIHQLPVFIRIIIK